MPRLAKWKGIFKRTEPIERYRQHFQFAGGDLDMCEKVDGAKVCPDRKGHYRMLYCERDPKVKDRYQEGYYKCTVRAEIAPLMNRRTYIDWLSSEPQGMGFGSRHYKELERWLEQKKCQREVLLHAKNDEAAAFWRKMNYLHINDKSDPEERDWVHHYRTLEPYKKFIRPPHGCAGGFTPAHDIREYKRDEYYETYPSDEEVDDDDG